MSLFDLPPEIIDEILLCTDGEDAFTIYQVHPYFQDNDVLKRKIKGLHFTWWWKSLYSRPVIAEEFAEKYYRYVRKNLNYCWHRFSEAFLSRHEEDVDWRLCNFKERSSEFQKKYKWTQYPVTETMLEAAVIKYSRHFGVRLRYIISDRSLFYWQLKFARKHNKPIKFD